MRNTGASRGQIPSDVRFINPKYQTQPTWVKAQGASDGADNGKILGVTSRFQYRLKGASGGSSALITVPSAGGGGGGGGGGAAPQPEAAIPPALPVEAPATESGAKPVQTIRLKIGSREMIQTVGTTETKTQFDAAPFIRSGRTMMPLRYAAEALGLKVQWNAQTKTAILVDSEGKEIQIPVTTNRIVIDGTTYTADVAPIIEGARIYLSISNLAKALGLESGKQIQWDAETKEITFVM